MLNDAHQVKLPLVLSLLVAAYAASVFAIAGCSLCKPSHGLGLRLIPLLASAGLAIAVTISFCPTRAEVILRTTRHVCNRIDRHFAISVGCIAGLAFTSSLFVSKIVLRTFPNSGDEFAYLFQAATFLDGRIWNPPPPISHIFSPYHIIETADVWVGKYPPGWPGIIALFSSVGIKPWIATPALNGFTVLLVAYLGREIRDVATGILAAILYAATAFSVFNGASFFNHTFTAVCAVAFSIFAIRFLKSATLWTAIATGAMLGLVGLTRTYSAALLAIPLSINVMLTRNSRLIAQALVGLGLGGGPFLAGLLLYNQAITGNALMAPQMLYDTELYGTGLWGFSTEHAAFDSIRRLGLNLIELAEWTSAPLLTVYFIFFGYLAICGRLKFVDFLFPVLLVGLTLYHADPWNRYGPRFLFEAYPFLALTCASGLNSAIERLEKRRSMLAASAVLLCILAVIAALMRIPVISAAFSRVIEERMDLYNNVEKIKLDNAIVLVQSGVGLLFEMDRRDLTRNWPSLTQPVLYVDGKADIPELKARFPSRTIWIYTREPQSSAGELMRID
jgi:hypothetical protein